MWDLTAVGTGHGPVRLRQRPDAFRPAITFSPDSGWLAAGGPGQTVSVWNLSTMAPDGAPFATLTCHPEVASGTKLGGEYPKAIEFSPDGRWLAAHGFGIMTLWPFPLPAGVPAPQPAGFPCQVPKSYITSLSFTRDSQFAVSASNDGTLSLWPLKEADPSGAPVVLRGHEKEEIKTTALSRDGRWLVSGGSGVFGSGRQESSVTVRLWPLTRDGAATGFPLRGHKAGVALLACDPDSRWLATASDDGQVYVWLLRLDDLLATAARTAGRNLTADEWRQYFPGIEYAPTFPELGIPSGVPVAKAEEAYTRAQLAVQRGDRVAAAAHYKNAAAWAVQSIDARLCNKLGWDGCLDGFAGAVLSAAERALALAPDVPGYRDTRGIARALTGDRPGAIADFEAFIAAGTSDPAAVQQRKDWVSKLRTGGDPFDLATLQSLRGR